MKYAAFINENNATIQSFDRIDVNIVQENNTLLCNIIAYNQKEKIIEYSKKLNINTYSQNDIPRYRALALMEISKMLSNSDIISLGEAIQNIRSKLKDKTASTEIIPNQQTDTPLITEIPESAAVYVDGSYNPNTKEAGWGYLIFTKSEQFQKNGRIQKDKCFDFNESMSGELTAAKEAIKFCWIKGYKNIRIYYDHYGIEEFTKQQHSSNYEIEEYINFINRMKKDMQINFSKVKSHSNDRYNDIVDKLAKTAVGL